MPEWFSRIKTLTNCSHDGKSFYDDSNGFGLEIPEGAIPQEKTITIDIGVALHGPFEIPHDLKRLSPVFWVCVRESEFSHFLKPVTITIPHCLALESSETIKSLGITFLKGGHDITAQHIILYQFQKVKASEMLFQPQKTNGALKTVHFCSHCIVAKVSPEVIQHTKFCIFPEAPKAVDPSKFTLFISYSLPTCIETIKEQMKCTNPTDEERCIPFRFAQNINPALEIVLPSTPFNGWNIGLQGETEVCLYIHVKNPCVKNPCSSILTHFL